MHDKKNFFKANKAGLVLGAAFLVTLTGCVGYVDGPRAGVYASPPVVEIQDDYVYYPNYECYYSVSRHQYAYFEGGAWVSRPAPRGVSVNVLMASPSVKMDFHDSPAHHHSEVVRKYPRNWAPPGSHQGQKEDRQEDRRDNRGDNHGR
jgi:hypothetical protein